MKARLVLMAMLIPALCIAINCRGTEEKAEPAIKAENPVPNASFEQAGRNERPARWRSETYGGRATFEYAQAGHTGSRSVMINSAEGADASWSAQAPIRPYSKYRFSGWIKTENIVTKGGAGALFNFHGTDHRTKAITGTNDWTKIEYVFESESMDAVQINCLYGGWGSATGKARYDDINLELLETKEMKPTAAIDASKKGEPISKYIYGQFIEHLGRCIYGGIWAEMLEDRKFYYPVNAAFDAETGTQEPQAERFPVIRNSPWKIIGSAEAVKMIKENPYVGEQTPQITLAGDGSPAGIIQGNLGLVKGKDYVGRVILAGDSDAGPIKVSLIWGKDADQKQTRTIEKITSDFVKYPVSFTAGGASLNGRLEIVGLGKGAMKIGTASLMPADNIEGMRADTLKVLKELNSPIYRWPGGNFVSGYNWRDGIDPDRDKRPPRKNPAWTGIEHNDFGIHEFMIYCKLLGTEPMVAVNTGLGTVEETAAIVEYANGSQDTELGKLRAKNGSKEPFNIKYWCVGNEMYGGWQLGNMPLEKYVLKHNDCVIAMRKKDPSIKVIAVGEVGRWDEMMLSKSADYIDLMSEHFYCQERPSLMSHIAWPSEHIKRIANAHREYRKTIGELKGKDIRIAMDEWNFWYGPHDFGELGTRYFLKDGLGIAKGLHEYFRNSDIIFMANYAQTVNVIGCIKTTRTAAALETTGLVLKLYRQEFGSIPLTIEGSPTPLDVAAAVTADGKKLTIGIVNPMEEEVSLPISFKGVKLTGNGKLWVMAGTDPQAYNQPGEKLKIDIVEKPAGKISDKIAVPPLSVSLYSLEIK